MIFLRLLLLIVLAKEMGVATYFPDERNGYVAVMFEYISDSIKADILFEDRCIAKVQLIYHINFCNIKNGLAM